MVTAQNDLLTWYRAVGRDLPWRTTRDPYRILVSEVMLQQTQVDRVIPFYQRFMAQFPTEQALAAADIETIHRAWKGLGYPSRVERLQAACRVVGERGGAWPTTVEGLRELPGIGPYTSGALACFAFAQSVPVVDTNVARVYARRDGLPLPLDKDTIWKHAAGEVSTADPIAYTNALMDLGATVCTARAPRCTVCPWLSRCVSSSKPDVQAASSNPLKVASVKVDYGAQPIDHKRQPLHIVLALIHHDGKYLVARRKSGQYLGNLWEFPGGKRETGEGDRIAVAREVLEEVGLEVLAARAWMNFSHEYGDRYLAFHVYRCRVFNPEAAKPLASSDVRWLVPEELLLLEFPPANAPILARLRRYHRLASPARRKKARS